MKARKYRTFFFLLISALLAVFLHGKSEAITFGIEYGNPAPAMLKLYPKIARTYAQIGIHSIKIQEIKWDLVEPDAPKKGVHRYKWEKVDKLISIFQKHGFRDIEIVLQATSSWASRSLNKIEKKRRPPGGDKISSIPPAQKHWNDYSDFVQSVVERYDADGVDDMPGLLYPVLEYEIETEAQGSYAWVGTAKEYTKLLRTAYKAARAANPKTKIILSGFLLGDVPRAGENINERIKKVGKIKSKGNRLFENKFDVWERIFPFNREILKEKSYYDLAEFHLLGSYTTMYDIVAWIRGEMKKNGYEKPILSGDTSSAPGLFWGPIEPFPTPFSKSPIDLIGILAKTSDSEYGKIHSWYRAEQSRQTVKKSVIAVELGLVKINFGALIDNPLAGTLRGRLFAWRLPFLYNWGIAGFIDNDYKPHPGYYTFKLTVEKLKDAKFVKRLSLGKEVYAVELSSHGKPLYVCWHNKKGSVNFPVGPSAKAVKITNIVTELGKKYPRIVNMDVKGGKVKLDLDINPVFIEPL